MTADINESFLPPSFSFHHEAPVASAHALTTFTNYLKACIDDLYLSISNSISFSVSISFVSISPDEAMITVFPVILLFEMHLHHNCKDPLTTPTLVCYEWTLITYTHVHTHTCARTHTHSLTGHTNF